MTVTHILYRKPSHGVENCLNHVNYGSRVLGPSVTYWFYSSVTFLIIMEPLHLLCFLAITQLSRYINLKADIHKVVIDQAETSDALQIFLMLSILII